MQSNKKTIFVAYILILCLSISACSNSKSDAPLPSPTVSPDLSGQWKQVNSSSEDNYHGAIINGDTIEIYWVSDGGDTRSLYWSGSYDAPLIAEGSYSWESKRDEEKTSSAILSSRDSSKSFTYENGQISYSASILGTTSTVRLEKEEWAPGLKIESLPPVDESSSDNANIEDDTTYFPLLIGDVEFSIPSYYEISDGSSAETSISFSVNTGDYVTLNFEERSVENQEDFDLNKDDLIDYFNSDEDFETVDYTDILLAGLPGISISATATADKLTINANFTFVYNENSKKVIMVAFAKVGNPEYDYSADFDKLIRTAKLVADTPSTLTSGIRPEFKDAMDSYEAFFDEYVAFMQKFSNSNDTLSLLSDYADYMTKYTETMEAFSEIGDSDMSTEEALYYMDVSNRISKKLLEVAQ